MLTELMERQDQLVPPQPFPVPLDRLVLLDRELVLRVQLDPPERTPRFRDQPDQPVLLVQRA